MVHGTPLGHHGGHGGRPLVGQHDGVACSEDGGHQCGGGDDGGDGHVPVEEAELGRAADEGIEVAVDARDRQAGHGGGVLNGGETVSGRLDHAQRGVGMVTGERRDGHDGVDAATERDERPPRPGVVGAGGA